MEINQRPIPDAALRDKDAVEMARIWIAEGKLHCSLKVGMYKETTSIPEEDAWGTILADLARHVTNALAAAYESDPYLTLQRIEERFVAELRRPSSSARGGFVKPH